jgi:hypothetical protein
LELSRKVVDKPSLITWQAPMGEGEVVTFQSRKG